MITVSAALAVAVLAAIIGFVQYNRAVAAKRAAQEAARRVTVALKEVEKAKSAAEEATKRATDALEQVKKAKSAADGLISFMQYGLRDTLGKLGHLEMMGAINARIMKYYEAHPPEAGDVAALRERGAPIEEQGNLFLAQGDLAGALKSYRDEVAIQEKLANLDPSNAGWQADLASSYWQTGTILARSDPRSRKEARSMIEKGRDILRQLKKETGLGVR